jgi:hypothetical protein
LKLEVTSANPVPFEISELSARRNLSFRWNKPTAPKMLDGIALWTIALDLLTSSNRRCGVLIVNRLYSTRDLQLDINLLTAAFPAALADAVERTLAHGAQVIPLPEQDAPLIAAQAG